MMIWLPGYFGAEGIEQLKLAVSDERGRQVLIAEGGDMFGQAERDAGWWHGWISSGHVSASGDRPERGRHSTPTSRSSSAR